MGLGGSLLLEAEQRIGVQLRWSAPQSLPFSMLCGVDDSAHRLTHSLAGCSFGDPNSVCSELEMTYGYGYVVVGAQTGVLNVL